MDCPSEEALIKMKLANLSGIYSMSFDLTARILVVFHKSSLESIFSELNRLNLGTSVIDQTIVSDGILPENPSKQAKILWLVLLINFFLFILEMATGFLSHSMGLIADSLDMLADSLVYALALLVVGGSMSKKNLIATISGYLQMGLAVIGILEVIRRFLGREITPDYTSMIVISVLALIGNATCLILLQKNKSHESHMKASMIFTSNDIIVNGGVILAGVLVYLTESKWPDLIVGSVVFILVMQGAWRILKLSSVNTSTSA